MKTITASERTTLIRLASSLPVGDDTRKAILHTMTHMVPVTDKEAGRTWDGTPGKAYDSPPSPGKSDCYVKGDIDTGKGKPGKGETCYRLHNEYGSGVSKDKKKYNKEYRDKWMDGHNEARTTCPDGFGGKKKCAPSE